MKRPLGLLIAVALGLTCQGAAIAAEGKSEAAFGYPYAGETAEQKAARMAWWHEAKFGMFIHWGLYAIPADGEWHMRKHQKPVAEYAAYAGQFNPVKFDADAWMAAAGDAGMKYLVITAKHHDGFAMFKSAASPFNIVDATPFRRDPLTELAAACPKHGVRFGVYYSGMADWHHPGGGAGCPHWDKAQDGDTDAYIDGVVVPQVRELMTNYGPLGEVWFDNDGAKGMTPERAARIFAQVKAQPGIIISPRLGKGDFAVAEQHISSLPPPGDWEACLTVNGMWGYSHAPAKSAETMIRKLIEVWSKGGNALLNVGPSDEGLIPADSLACLRAIGAWMKVNEAAIRGSTRGPCDLVSWGRTTAKGSTVFCHVFTWPADGVLRLPLTGTPTGARLLADPSKPLTVRQEGDRVLITLPKQAPDPIASVVAVEFATPPPRQRSLALGAKVRASPGATTPEKAVDDDGGSRCTLKPAADGAWLEIDLGKPTALATVRLDYSYGGIAKAILERQDGSAWVPITTLTRVPIDESIHPFAPVTAQVVRLHVTEMTEEPSLRTVELFAPE